ncbi:DoxX family protein [Nocardioides rotundus]|uniref:DoxX family protein n=1 Tax=Nocardioides rotundus TaxID=1774216 RepID=UPI001CBA974B|nr:DoxX family protein [Nocardioides rotundus]UAL30212.1 DoxX family protein [Nocardioides rotundus]
MSRLLVQHPPQSMRDLGLLIVRVTVGLVLVAHGWQKLQQGPAAVAEGFAAMGIPAPELAAWFALSVELVGGALLVLGLLTPLMGVLVAADMAGAWWFAHRGNGVFVSEGGGELAWIIGAVAVTLVLAGAGRFSVDRALARSGE